MYRRFYKPLLDKVLALVLLLGFSPVWGLVVLLTFLFQGGNVFFMQQRAGKHGEPFVLYKLRTMRPSETNHGNETHRVTKWGRLLRTTGLDEWPQLWNILWGDMSFVGPRPFLLEYVERYSEVQSSRHLVQPGLTGWAQIHGRNTIAWDERLKLDVEYVYKQSFFFDCYILLRTPWVLLQKKGSEPSEPFMGQDRRMP